MAGVRMWTGLDVQKEQKGVNAGCPSHVSLPSAQTNYSGLTHDSSPLFRFTPHCPLSHPASAPLLMSVDHCEHESLSYERSLDQI